MGSIPITRFCYVLNQEPGRQSGDRAPDLYSVIYVYKALKTRSKMSKSVNWQNDLFAEDYEWLYSVYKLLVIFDWYVKMPAQIIKVNISFTPLRPAARYAIFKTQRGKPQAATPIV